MKILVVDDDPLARVRAVEGLRQPHYEIRALDSGRALLAANQDDLDLILLDIRMPDMDGISACRALRHAGNDHSQVIFVSAQDDLETRLAAYHAGGCDFLVKPYDEEELAQKVQAIESLVKRRNALREQARHAQNTAFTAMSYMGESGVVLQSLRASFACSTPEHLANSIFAGLRQFGLSGLVEIRLQSGKQSFTATGRCSPLEESILQHATTMGRIFQFKGRLSINYPCVTLLVLGGLPLDDPDRVGRLRDHLAILMEGAEGRVQALETQLQKAAQAETIVQSVAALGEALADIERRQAESRARALGIHGALLADLTRAFVRLGLSEDQEHALAGMAHASHEQMEALMDDAWSVGDRLRAVAEQLRKVAVQ